MFSHMLKELFFIGICPPNPLKEDIHGLKVEIGQKYNTKGAFRSSAHITLQMPFKLGIKKLNTLRADLERFAQEIKYFDIVLKGFGAFEPRVVFIGVSENEKLQELHHDLETVLKKHQIFNSTHKNRGFHPHITVAFRDLKKKDFYLLWNEVSNKEFDKSFSAEGLTLFKHNGVSWDEYDFFPFKKLN